MFSGIWASAENFQREKKIFRNFLKFYFSYAVTFIFFLLKETDRRRSISLSKEFKLKMRHMAMRVLEGIYFIAILPMTVNSKNTIETTKTILLSNYICFICVFNLIFFIGFYIIKKKTLDWKFFYQMNGFWKEVGTASGRE